MPRHRLAFLALALTLVFALGACGSDDSDDGGSGGSADSAQGDQPAFVADAEKAVAENTAVPSETAAAALGGYTPKPDAKIFHIGCNQALDGCNRFAQAAKSASDALGYDFTLCDSKTTPETIGACFNQAVNAKPDAVVIQGVGADFAADGYAALDKAGIPIIGSVTGNPEGTKGVATEVNATTCSDEGRMLGEWIIADSGGEANVIVYYADLYTCLKQRSEEMKKALDKCDTCEVKLQQFNIDQLRTGLPQQMQADLQSNPDINYIYGTMDAVALIAVDAVRQTGKTDSIKVVGSDGDPPNVDLIENGEIQQATATSGFGEDGWLSVDAAARVIAGEDVPPQIAASVFILDGSNVEKAIQGSPPWEGPEDYQDQIKALWGS